MNEYRLEIRPSVEKALRKIRDAKLQKRLDEAFSKLAENPRRMGAEKMAGFENRYRFRVGDYRVIYEIHDAVLLVLILVIGDRKEIYRWKLRCLYYVLFQSKGNFLILKARRAKVHYWFAISFKTSTKRRRSLCGNVQCPSLFSGYSTWASRS